MAVEKKIDNGIRIAQAGAALAITGVLALPEFAQMVSADSALTASPTPVSGSCNFDLGFKTLHDAFPKQVGDCLDNESYNPNNGDALQHTTNGLLNWRKADNWTAFTDGYQTLVNGPCGIEERLNSQRYPWEASGFDVNGQRFQIVKETNPLCRFTVATAARGGGGGGGDNQTPELTPTPTPDAKPTPPPGGRAIEPELDPNNPTNEAANLQTANNTALRQISINQSEGTTHITGKIRSYSIDGDNLILSIYDRRDDANRSDTYSIPIHNGRLDIRTWSGGNYWEGNDPSQVMAALRYYLGPENTNYGEVSINNTPNDSGIIAYFFLG